MIWHADIAERVAGDAPAYVVLAQHVHDGGADRRQIKRLLTGALTQIEATLDDTGSADACL
ncbi:hypothetical protein [Salinisphaera sp. T31B1]|uniref:hypothetical protein n=1 Tax=Salinisphaera sp. T31B1 TaxID=727963 RepID=UPI0033420A8E